MLTLAFYKAPGNWQDWLIRLATRSPYSHVELAVNRTETSFMGYSSSPRDGGVVAREVSIKEGHWDFLDVPWAEEQDLIEYVNVRLGQPYDWLAIVGSHFFRFGWELKDAWICSELIAAGLTIPRAWEPSPAQLHQLVEFITFTWERSPVPAEVDEQSVSDVT